MKDFAGIEIENRLYGLITYFVTHKLTDYSKIKEYAHIYFQKQVIEENGYDTVLQLLILFPKKIITVDIAPDMIEGIPHELYGFSNFHIAVSVRIQARLDLLRNFDTIKIEYDDHYLFVAVVGVLHKACPENYKEDYFVE